MECPYCGQEMVKGLIQAHSQNRPFKWFAEDNKKKDSFGAWFRGSGGMSVGKADLLYGARVTVYYCEACKKMIINLDEDSENGQNAQVKTRFFPL